jgi:hypothetical protein
MFRRPTTGIVGTASEPTTINATTSPLTSYLLSALQLIYMHHLRHDAFKRQSRIIADAAVYR